MRKFYSLLAAVVLMAVGSVGAWAAGYTRTLTESLEIAGYKAKAFYNFQTNDPAVLPESGDLRYRSGNIWGLHNFGSGPRSGSAAIPVAEGDILVLQHYSSSVVSTIDKGTLNETLSSAAGYQVYDITSDAESVTFTIARYGGIVAALVMEADASAAKADYIFNYVYNGEVIDSTKGESVVGATVVADKYLDKTTGEGDDATTVRYLVKVDSLSSFEVAADSNIFNVEMRLAEKWSYKVTSAIAGEILPWSTTGEVWENENAVGVRYPRFQEASNHALVGLAPVSNDLKRTITVANNNYKETLEYAAVTEKVDTVDVAVTNLYLLSEAEDLELDTLVSKGTTTFASRVSGGQMVYGADSTKLVTLPEGKFIFTLGVIGGASDQVAGYKVYAGDTLIIDGTCAGNILTLLKSGEFELTEETDIVVKATNTNSNRGIDLLYVQKTDGFPFDIKIAEDIKGGKVVADKTQAKAGDTVKLTITPDENYKLDELEVIAGGVDPVDVNDDYSFVMPEDYVEISATFKPTVIYLDQDYTTQLGIDAASWTGASGLCATNFAPAITTKDGRTAQLAEKYETTVETTGDLITQTVKGLANGTYRVSIYANAFYTAGRGFDSSMTDGAEDVCYVFAGSGENRKEQFIVAKIATETKENNLRTLENVKVTDGTLVVGLGKAKAGTNWHTVQVYEITAQVLATEALASSVKAAEDVKEADVPAALYTELQKVVADNNKEYESAEEYKAAIAAIDAAVAKAQTYAPLAAVIAEGEGIKANVEAGDAAIAAYDAAIADVKSAYDAATVEDIAKAVAAVEAALPALAKAQTKAGSDMTRTIVNAAVNGADGWTVERPKGGNGPLLGGTAFEYWAGNANPREEAAFDYYQEIEGLPNGKYTVSAEMYNSLNGEDGAVFAAAAGVYASSGEDNEVSALVDKDGTDLVRYTTKEITVTNGTLRIGVKNVEALAARWFVADNFQLTLVEAISADAINGVAAGEAAQKANGKYLENGKIVIYKNGKKFNVAGAALK